MTADAKERAFQNDVIREMRERGWLLGEPAKYDRERALYTEDCLAFVKTTQPKTWEKYQKLYPRRRSSRASLPAEQGGPARLQQRAAPVRHSRRASA